MQFEFEKREQEKQEAVERNALAAEAARLAEQDRQHAKAREIETKRAKDAAALEAKQDAARRGRTLATCTIGALVSSPAAPARERAHVVDVEVALPSGVTAIVKLEGHRLDCGWFAIGATDAAGALATSRRYTNTVTDLLIATDAASYADELRLVIELEGSSKSARVRAWLRAV